MMNQFDERVREATGDDLCCSDIATIQVNIGLKCNLQCVHCHVASSPHRKEMMSWPTMQQVIDAAKRTRCKLVDITGGAPELHPDLRRFIRLLHAAAIPVMIRTNLTVLLEPGMQTMPRFLRDHRVQLVASLPCYLESNVDGQRGSGVFKGSIDAIRILNDHGYGSDPELPLSLVYNPVGPHLPPEQSHLEADYRRELNERFAIHFTNLITIANMPIGRYVGVLKKQNKLAEYTQLLRDSFNAATLDRLMCRHQINVDWEGNIYDCDFNLALKLSVDHGAPNHIRDFDPVVHAKRRIVTGSHCFGCTAGAGSSCSGALV
ncbi:MAG: arsenosugar biosynthesis radical SAM protein ArsS [Candidatus Krumholzibacteria bacterium]|nr:arsenosugar biosynthesis radical SAM protein ArsS [Candidatus Krumholzibacteria bacterium]